MGTPSTQRHWKTEINSSKISSRHQVQRSLAGMEQISADLYLIIIVTDLIMLKIIKGTAFGVSTDLGNTGQNIRHPNGPLSRRHGWLHVKYPPVIPDAMLLA